MSVAAWRPGWPLEDLGPAVDWLEARARERGYEPAQLAGISVGGCVDAIGTSRVGAMRRQAHTHTDAADQWAGWVCVAAHSLTRLVSSTGLPTVLFRHEYAHLLAPRDGGHGQAWRRAVTALGAPGEAKSAAARSVERKARLANTVYYRDGVPISREEYLQRQRDRR